MADIIPSFPLLLQRFFVDHLRQQRAVSSNTIAAYRDTFRLFLKFAHRHLGRAPTDLALVDLTADLILAFLDHIEQERKGSARSRNARLSAIRSFLKYAAHEDITALATIERCLAIPQKRHDKPVLGFLTRPEMEAIIAAPDRTTWSGRRDQALFSLLYNTGARISEAIDLKVGDVVLDTSPVAHLHGKGRKRRSVPLWKATATTLRQWLRHLPDGGLQAQLFPNSAGAKLTRSSAAQRLALAVGKAAGQFPTLMDRKVSPHTIRHYLPRPTMSGSSDRNHKHLRNKEISRRSTQATRHSPRDLQAVQELQQIVVGPKAG